jgi:hypothetical protein
MGLKIAKGDMIKFAFLAENKILIGKVVDDDLDNFTGVNVLTNTELDTMSFLVHNTEIIGQVGIHRKGLPAEYIKDFRMANSKYEPMMIDVFTNGHCYTFARWLSDRLFRGEVVYLPYYHHYVVRWSGRLYDITGDVTEQYKDSPISTHRFEGDWAKDR